MASNVSRLTAALADGEPPLFLFHQARSWPWPRSWLYNLVVEAAKCSSI